MSQDERDTERDGAFSYAAEVHAFAIGVYKGCTSLRSHPSRSDSGTVIDATTNKDVEREPHYYAGGYVLGTLLQVMVIGVTAVGTYNVM